jgi:formyl-CoA transferase
MSTPRTLPLDGIRVLDFSQVQFGPMATQILADFGAEVIKIERPRLGDISRTIDVKSDGIDDSASFLSLNRNKRSMVLDMKNPKSMTIVDELLHQSDVIVSNFRAGVAERMGLGYESLKQKFPTLIYASGTGFGDVGPLSGLGGQDMVLQSLSGATWHNRDGSGRPGIYPVPFVDFSSGMALVQGILLALLERAKSGLGQRVDVSLLDTALFTQMQEYTQWMMRRFELHWERDNLVGSFKTSDGWMTIVGLFRPDPLEAVCEGLGIDNLTKRPEFSSAQLQLDNREKLWQVLDVELSRYTTEEAVEKLSSRGVLCGPVLDYDAVLAHPQVELNGRVRSMEHPTLGSINVIDNPISMSAVIDRPFVAAPLLGQHTDEVLQELGYSMEQIDALERDGVVDRWALVGSRPSGKNE